MPLQRVQSCAAAALLALNLGAVPHHDPQRMASARIVASALPYLPGSDIPLRIEGLEPPYVLQVVGAGSIDQGLLRIPLLPPSPSATVIASAPSALAMHTFTFAHPPDPKRAMIAVAAYDSGVVIHDATAPFTARAVFGAGSPSDVAFDDTGRLAAGDTAGDTLQIARLDPWSVATFSGVPFVDELAFDDSGDLFASDRDSNGSGALTRIAPDGTITRRALGLTSEGVAIDSRRHRVYVANVNDGTISIVDARTMTERARFHAIDRVFSLALSGDGARLYAVSNQSVGSPFSAPGRVVAFDVRGAKAHVAAQSAPLSFPVGIAVDDAHGRVFVTDERDDTVSVLDASTLRSQHRPLPTCRTPWKPTLDPQGQRLYVPCAQADEVDVFDLPSLQRAHGAPFKTGGYPLAVAVWHPDHHVVR